MKYEQLIQQQAEQLLATAKTHIIRLLREGKSLKEIEAYLEQIIPNISNFRESLYTTALEVAKTAQYISGDVGPGVLTLEAPELIASANMTVVKTRTMFHDFFRKEVRRAIAAGLGAESFRRRLEEKTDAFGEQFATVAQTQIAAYNNLLTFKIAEESGIETFLYSGPLNPTTRPFCRAHVGKIFTKEQILKMDNGQGLPVMETCGGYNCRHQWVATEQEKPESKKILRIGKQVFVVDDESEKRLFEHTRQLYVQATRPSNYSVAMALAHLHDGLNPEIINSPNSGKWTNRMRIDVVTGEKLSNFEAHFRKHSDEFTSIDSYRKTMHTIVNDTTTEVYEDPKGFLLYHRKLNCILISNKEGFIETMFRWTDKKRWSLDGKKFLGTLEKFIGKFS